MLPGGGAKGVLPGGGAKGVLSADLAPSLVS